MFYSLTGNVVYRDEQFIALNCSGVAFKCFTTSNTSAALSNASGEVTLYTHLNVREDALDLFGFYTKEELSAFKMLTGVSGVGAKMAIAVLSALTPEAFALAVATGDTKSITLANGVGAKLAQRIIMELKDKISSADFVSSEGAQINQAASASSSLGNSAEAVSALVALGYSQSEASVAVSKLDQSLSVEELVKGALKNLVIRF